MSFCFVFLLIAVLDFIGVQGNKIKGCEINQQDALHMLTFAFAPRWWHRVPIDEETVESMVNVFSRYSVLEFTVLIQNLISSNAMGDADMQRIIDWRDENLLKVSNQHPSTTLLKRREADARHLNAHLTYFFNSPNRAKGAGAVACVSNWKAFKRCFSQCLSVQKKQAQLKCLDNLSIWMSSGRQPDLDEKEFDITKSSQISTTMTKSNQQSTTYSGTTITMTTIDDASSLLTTTKSITPNTTIIPADEESDDNDNLDESDEKVNVSTVGLSTTLSCQNQTVTMTQFFTSTVSTIDSNQGHGWKDLWHKMTSEASPQEQPLIILAIILATLALTI